MLAHYLHNVFVFFFQILNNGIIMYQHELMHTLLKRKMM